jgi:hypothetical protein
VVVHNLCAPGVFAVVLGVNRLETCHRWQVETSSLSPGWLVESWTQAWSSSPQQLAMAKLMAAMVIGEIPS